MTLRLLCTCLLGAIVSLEAVSAEPIRIRGPQGNFDASHGYYQGLIELAYEKIGKPISIEYSPYMVQGRALNELRAGRLVDIYWAGTDESREQALGVVKIPLNKGLLGYRVFITHRDNIERFKKVTKLDDLRDFRLCQGAHWPDTDILLSSGLVVSPNPVYENMFRQTNAKRCDAFPRGINEAQSEIEARKNSMPDLQIYKDLIIYYPFPMYFFVQKGNTQLLSDLEKGLEMSISDGSFDRYMESHPSTKHLFPNDRWNKSEIFIIDNPFLSKEINTNDERYWIVPPGSKK